MTDPLDSTDRRRAMSAATDFTRPGRLAEATALVRRTLRGSDNSGGRGSAGPGRVRGLLRRLRGPSADTEADDSPADTGVVPRPATRTAPPGPVARTATPGPVATPAPGLTRNSYSGPTGKRPYLVYVPDRPFTEPVPLVVMLHGGTQDAAGFAAATGMNALADRHGFVVVYPEQVLSANPMRFWKWFSPSDQRRGTGESAIITGIIAEVAATHPIDSGQVLVAGFSAGAGMAAVLGHQYPDVVTAVGVHSGVASGVAKNVRSALSAMRSAPPSTPVEKPVPVIVFHGDQDKTVNVANAREVARQFCPEPLYSISAEGHTGRPFTREILTGPDGTVTEIWTVHGAGHVWSGGVAGGSFADPAGPDASAEMVRFLLGVKAPTVEL